MPQNTPVIAQMLSFTANAIEAMKNGKPGDQFTPQQMTEITGTDCSATRGRRCVDSARRNVERNFGIVWCWDRTTKSWHCLDDAQKSESVTGFIDRSRRLSRRASNRARTVDESALSEEQRKQHRLRCVTTATLELFASGVVQKRLEKVNSALTVPDPQKLIEVMKNS